jgi:hypothetical protein
MKPEIFITAWAEAPSAGLVTAQNQHQEEDQNQDNKQVTTTFVYRSYCMLSYRYQGGNTKQYIEKYSMFEHIRYELLANSKRYSDLSLINDALDNDYFRFIDFEEIEFSKYTYKMRSINKQKS